MSTKEKLIALWASNKKVILIVLAGLVVIGGAAGVGYGVHKNNSKKADTMFTQDVDNGDSSAQQGEVEVAPPAEEEIVSFKDKDKDLNTLTLTPIFNDDGVQIIAGYILEAVDKDGKKLTADEYPLLNSVVSATRNGNNGMLVKDADSDLIPMETLSNEDGDLIAIKDVMDLDGDKDMDEYFKLVHSEDANGIKKISIKYENVEVKTDDKDNKVVVDKDKEIAAKVVDKNNEAAAKKEMQETKKNETTKEKVKKKQDKEKEKNPSKDKDTTSTTKPSAPSTTLPGSSDNGKDPTKPTSKPTDPAKPTDPTKKEDQNPTKPTSKPTDPTDPTEPEEEDDGISIVLKKNSKAECDSSNVEISNATVLIKAEGDYVITSETDLWRGCIKVQVPSGSKTAIKFKNVDISYDTENIIQIINTDANEEFRNKFLDTEVDSKPGANEVTFDDLFANFSDLDTVDVPEVSLSFPEGTKSTFKCNSNKLTGVLYNESKLKIKGKGNVLFESIRNSNNCICSTKSITIDNCNVSLVTANSTVPEKIATNTGAAKGIFSYGRVTVEGGSLSIRSNGDAIRCSRFYAKGGTMDIKSSACDAFDVDSEIEISGGTVNATALQKSCFKVRAVNNNGGAYTSKSGKVYTFKIAGGTVIGEGSKSTAVQKSDQPSIRMYIGTYSPAAKNDKKMIFFPGVPMEMSIKSGDKTVVSSSNKCTTFLYSSSSLSAENGKYKMYTSKMPDGEGKITFNGKIGEVAHPLL